MKFKIDENLPIELVNILQKAGYDAVSVLEESLRGCSHDMIVSVCKDEDRVLITLDTDFADICNYPPQKLPGIMVLRLRRYDKNHILKVVQRLILLLSVKPLKSRLWIVEDTRVRIRE